MPNSINFWHEHNMVPYLCHPATWEAGTVASKVQSHPQLQSEFKTRLVGMRPCQKERTGRRRTREKTEKRRGRWRLRRRRGKRRTIFK